MQQLIERTAPVAGQSTNEVVGAQPGAVSRELSSGCWWWSGAAAITCLVLRLTNILALPLHSDESMYVRSGQFVALGWSQLLVQLNHGTPPMVSWLEAPFMLLHLWSPIVTGRVVIALTGLCTCLLVMACAAQLGGRRLVPLAAWAYALSPYAVFNDRMAMLDGPLATWGALALFFTLRLSRKPDGPSSLPNLVGLGLAIGAAWLTKFFAAWLELLPLLLAALASGVRRAARMRLALLPLSISLGVLVPFLLAPNGASLVADVHEHGTGHALLPTLLGQFGAVGGWALLYLTPPGLALCLLGATLCGRRGWRLVAVWLGLSAMTYASIPTTFAASRYLFFLAVPAVLLIALGADHVLRRVHPRPAVALLALALVPALVQDGLLVVAPAHALLVPFDRWQYVQGWPAGYGFPETVAWLKRAARRGPVVVACSFVNPPGDALHEELDGDPNVTILLLDIGNAQAGVAFARAHPGAFIVTDEQAESPALSAALRARVREAARFWKPGRRAAYVIYQVLHPTT